MTMEKTICIEKICNLPVNHRNSDKSAHLLATESKFGYLYSEMSLQEIKNYLSTHRHLIREWEIWTEDKRTWGYGLSINDNRYSIGYRDSKNVLIFSKSFTDKTSACAEYIFREV